MHSIREAIQRIQLVLSKEGLAGSVAVYSHEEWHGKLTLAGRQRDLTAVPIDVGDADIIVVFPSKLASTDWYQVLGRRLRPIGWTIRRRLLPGGDRLLMFSHEK